MLCLQMTCIHSKSPQQLHPLNPVALGLAVPPMDLSSSKLPSATEVEAEGVQATAVDTGGVQNTLQPSQHHGSLQENDTEPDAGDKTLSDAATSSTDAGKNVELAKSQLPAHDSMSADALGFHAQLYSMLLSQQSQAPSIAALPMAQPQPNVSPYQSQPLCLPPRPRKSALRDARKANASPGGSTKNSTSCEVQEGGSKQELVSL